MPPLEFHHLYIGREQVILPTLARTPVGRFDVEPVAVVPLADTEGLRAALTELLARGNREAPAPVRGSYRPVVLDYAKARSWAAFAKKHEAIGITRFTEEEYEIVVTCRDAKGDSVDDPARTWRVRAAEVIPMVLREIGTFRV